MCKCVCCNNNYINYTHFNHHHHHQHHYHHRSQMLPHYQWIFNLVVKKKKQGCSVPRWWTVSWGCPHLGTPCRSNYTIKRNLILKHFHYVFGLVVSDSVLVLVLVLLLLYITLLTLHLSQPIYIGGIFNLGGVDMTLNRSPVKYAMLTKGMYDVV